MQIGFAGDEGSVVFHIELDATIPDDLRCDRVTVSIGRSFSGEARTRVALDVAELHDALTATLDTPDLTGEVSVASFEGDFHLLVSIASGRGEMRGRIEPDFRADGGMDFTIATDQSCLADTRRQVAAVMRSAHRECAT